MPPSDGNFPLDGRTSGKSWVLWLIALLFIGFWFIRGSQANLPLVDYSQFKGDLAAGRIKEVEISKDRIIAQAEGNRRYQVIRVEDTNLTHELDSKKVPYRGRIDSDW